MIGDHRALRATLTTTGEKQRKVFLGAVACATAIGTMIGSALPSLAAPTASNPSWAGCSWTSHSGAVYVADSGFANDGTASDTGAKQSFHDRISAATSVWNAQTTSHAHAKTLTYSTSTANILVRNVTPPQPGDGTQTYGQTYVQTAYQPQPSADFYGTCPHNRTSGDITLQYARIDMQTRNDWFTQDDNQRKYWENCSNRTTYTCSKLLDFQSVVTHELGHAIGEAHPETTAQNNSADCSNSDTPSTVYDDSTMCHVVPHYTTRQRTLTTWDINSYSAHMNSF